MRFSCLIVMLLLAGFVWAQPVPKPGGLTGSFTELNLGHWFRAEDAGCTTDGCTLPASPAITAKQGANPQVTAGTVTFETGELNYNPSFFINASTLSFARQGGAAGRRIHDDFSVFVVYKANASPALTAAGATWWNDGLLVGGDEGGSDDCGLTLAGGAIRWGHNGSDAYSFASAGSTYDNGRTYMPSLTRQKTNSTNTGSFWIDGKLEGLGTVGNNNVNTITNFRMGKNLVASSQLNGHFGEVIMYGKILTTGERERVETYLGLKYGISLEHHYYRLTGTTLVKVFSDFGGFTNRKFGIAKCDSSLLNQQVSAATSENGLVLMHGATAPGGSAPFFNFLNDGSYPVPFGVGAAGNNRYQIIGDDNGSATTFSKNLGGGTANQLGRTWKVTDVGSVGPVTLWFKQSTFAALTSATNYSLAYGSDPDMGIGENLVPLTPVGLTNDHYVTVDFPNNDTVYFTLIKNTIFKGPANVNKGLELWLRSEKGVVTPAAITSWADSSGNGHHLLRTPVGGMALETGVQMLNYHRYIKANALVREMSTAGIFRGRTIVAVTRVQAAGVKSIAGFDGKKGLRTNGTNLDVGGVGVWYNGAANPQQNGGAPAASLPISKWSIIVARDSARIKQNRKFFLGHYPTASTPTDSLYFAELLVYDTLLIGANVQNRLETYLAIKYGITLQHDYIASNGSTVYSLAVPSYVNDVFGIGRDETAQLLQRQSTSQNATSIVGFAMDAFKPDEAGNLGAFGGDMHYLVAGHDNGVGGCWTTQELKVAGEEGQHVRIRREWKIQVTGAWTSGSAVKVQLQTNNANFLMPSLLPTGSTSYELYLSGSNNFNTLLPGDIFPANLVSPGVYEATIPAAIFGSGSTTFYMTFGAKLAPSFNTATICPGGTVKVFHSLVGTGDFCSQLTLTKTIAPFNTFVANTSTPGVTNTSFGGICIDTLRYALPLTIPAGVYTVKFDTSTSTTSCGSAGYGAVPVPGNAPVALATVTIQEPDTGNLVYPVGPFCMGSGNVVPTTFGPDPGVFSILAGPGGVPISSVVPNNTTGVIAIHSGLIPVGTTSTFNLQFVTNGPACRDTSTYSFTVNSNTTTTLSYAGSPYCGGLLTPQSPAPGLPVGTAFSSQPPLGPTELDPNTGVLNIFNFVNPGNYIITATPPSGLCISPSSTTIAVNAAIQAEFEYLDTTLCVGSGGMAPFITTLPSLGSFVASPAGLSLTASTGVINLNTSTPGTYNVDFVVGGAVACTLNTRDVIHVYAKPDASFTVTTDTLCANGAGTLCVPDSLGGTFTVLPGYLTVSGSTVSPTGNVGGPFWVGYRFSTAFCTDSTSENVWVNGLQVPTVQYGDTTFCKNEADPHLAFLSGTAGGDFIGSPGLVIDTTGTIDLAATAAGTNYVVSYVSPDLACPNTSVVATVDVRAIASAAFTLTPTAVCARSGNLGINVLPVGPPSNQLTIWSGNVQIVNGITAQDSIDVDSLPSGGPFEIRNIRDNGYCQDTAYDYLVVNRRDSADIEFNPNKVCVGDFDPYPVNLGDGGGTFLAVGANAIGAGVDLLTGTVDLDSSSAQVWYTVRYTTAGVCPSTDIDSVELALKVPAFFHYRFLNYCLSYPGIVAPDSIASPGDGLFSAGVGLVIDSTTGVVNLDSSVAGTYNVRYKIKLNGACADDYVVTLTLVAEVTGATLTVVPNDSFCWRGSENVVVQVANAGLSGGVFSSDVGLVFSNFELGEVSLAGSYPQRDSTYTIFYTLSTVCEEVFTTEISIAPRDTARFDYADNAYCNQSPDELPSLATPPGGIFTIYSDSSNALANSTIDQQTGLLPLLFNSGEGTVGIQYLTVGACPDSTITYIRISDPPTDYEMLVNTGNVICEGTPVLVTGTGATFNFYYLNGDSVDSGNETTFLNLQDNDTVTVEFITDLGCKVYLDTVFEVQPIPYDRIVSYPDIISGGDPFEINVQATTSDKTYFEWFIVDYQGALEFPAFSGYSLDTIDSGAVSAIPIALTMTEDFSPAQFTFMVQPRTELCRGPFDTVLVKVNPNQQDIFVPQVMTPDGNGQNDTWLIQWKDVINPSDYTILLYNEAGAKVLTMTPLKSDWGGDNLPDGVYWYLMLNAKGELVESGSGGLTIRRK